MVRQHRGITSDTALSLARYFNTTPQFWLNLQTNFNLKQTSIQVGDIILREIQPMQVEART